MNLVHRSIGRVIEHCSEQRGNLTAPTSHLVAVNDDARTTGHFVSYLLRFGIRFRLSKLSIDRRTDRALAGDRSPAFHFDSEVQ
jgi:hypothetical protein